MLVFYFTDLPLFCFFFQVSYVAILCFKHFFFITKVCRGRSCGMYVLNRSVQCALGCVCAYGFAFDVTLLWRGTDMSREGFSVMWSTSHIFLGAGSQASVMKEHHVSERSHQWVCFLLKFNSIFWMKHTSVKHMHTCFLLPHSCSIPIPRETIRMVQNACLLGLQQHCQVERCAWWSCPIENTDWLVDVRLCVSLCTVCFITRPKLQEGEKKERRWSTLKHRERRAKGAKTEQACCLTAAINSVRGGGCSLSPLYTLKISSICSAPLIRSLCSCQLPPASICLFSPQFSSFMSKGNELRGPCVHALSVLTFPLATQLHLWSAASQILT